MNDTPTSSVFDSLARTRTLWLSFVATVLLTVSFVVVAPLWQLTLLDGLSDPDQVRQVLSAMSSEQRVAHAWITGTLDVAYPLAYGALFIGSACAFFPSVGHVVGWLMVLLIGVDLVEGVVQIAALLDTVDWIDAKAFLTPLKSGLFMLGLAVMVAGWGAWLVRRFFG